MLDSVKQLMAKKGHGGLFSALALHPLKTKFEAQDSHEEIILLIRAHLITNLWWVLTAALMTLVPLIFPSLPAISRLPGNYLFILTLLWYAIILTFIFEKFLMWFFSVNIVTDERIIDVDFYGLLFKHVSVCAINRIEDVNYYQKGVASSIFNFGDVLIQTAAEITEFVFDKVPNPEQVVKIISELIAQEEQEALEGRVR